MKEEEMSYRRISKKLN